VRFAPPERSRAIFPPGASHSHGAGGPHFEHFLWLFDLLGRPCIVWEYAIWRRVAPVHLEWSSDLLLRWSRARHGMSIEWVKLECWAVVVWIVRPTYGGQGTVKDLERAMSSLFRCRSGVTRKAEQWMGRCKHYHIPNISRRSLSGHTTEGHDMRNPVTMNGHTLDLTTFPFVLGRTLSVDEGTDPGYPPLASPHSIAGADTR